MKHLEKETPGTKYPAKFCLDPRHETPCPLPCDACADECDGSYEEAHS